jgi:hypothetical protein
MTSLHRRVAKLEALCGRPEEPCPDPRPTVILDYTEGEPKAAVPADAARCRHCHQVHVLWLQEVVLDHCERCGQTHAIDDQCGAPPAPLGVQPRPEREDPAEDTSCR